MADLYRKSALERMSSPEQLDKAIVVTSPMSWLALAAATVIVVGLIIWSFVGNLTESVDAVGIVHDPIGVCTVYSDGSGTVLEVPAQETTYLTPGTIVARYRIGSLGDVREICATQEGTVTSVLIKPGDQIKPGQDIIRFTPRLGDTHGSRPVIVCYVNQVDAEKLSVGKINNRVTLKSDGSQRYGHMFARILSIDGYAATESGMGNVIGTGNNLAAELNPQNKPVVAVVCDLELDPTSENGYKWSSRRGKSKTVNGNDLVTVKFVTRELKPIEKLLYKLSEVWDNPGEGK